MEHIKVRKPTGRPRINNDTRDLVVKLYNEDVMTVAQIAKSINISVRSVQNIISERRTENAEKEETN